MEISTFSEATQLWKAVALPPSGAGRTVRRTRMRGPTVRLRRLGSELRALRKGRQLTVDDVVRHTGMSTGSLSRVENGATKPKTADLDALLDLYRVAGSER